MPNRFSTNLAGVYSHRLLPRSVLVRTPLFMCRWHVLTAIRRFVRRLARPIVHRIVHPIVRRIVHRVVAPVIRQSIGVRASVRSIVRRVSAGNVDRGGHG